MKTLLKKCIKIGLMVISGLVIVFILFFLTAIPIFQTAVNEVSEERGEDFGLLKATKSVISLYMENRRVEELKEQSQKEEVNHITIYYNPEQKDILTLTNAILQRAEQLTKMYLGYDENSPVDLIFMSMEELGNLSNGENVAGFYSDLDKMIAIGIDEGDVSTIVNKREEYPFYLFQETILHEYAHYATISKLEKSGVNYTIVPTWFIEGVAAYIGENERDLEFQSFQPNFIKLEQLETSQQWEVALGKEDAQPYIQGYFTLAFLIDNYGDNVISTLIDETSISKNFQQSLQKVTGKKIEELEMDIINYYEK